MSKPLTQKNSDSTELASPVSFGDQGDKLNINITVYRVLFILRVLVRYQTLNLNELNGFLEENPVIQKSFHEETLVNYINALRQLGCDIQRPYPRNGYRYQLLRHPFMLVPSETEQAAIQKTLHLLKNQPDEALQYGFHNILRRVFSDPVFQSCLSSQPEDPSARLQKNKELLKQYRGLCKDALLLELTMINDSGELVSVSIEPHQVSRKAEKLYLTGLNRSTGLKEKIGLDKILRFRQRASKISQQAPPQTICFKLTQRLMKTYRLYPDEQLLEKTETHLLVQSKTIEPEALMKRLLKYNTFCEVLSPESFRTKIQHRIEQLLNAFD
ncbi:MAG: hypothetical protein K2X66_10845 [Cyanobacteria bacterium]|nr:hypothetical protein [Cyanobacteriota bacterium]